MKGNQAVPVLMYHSVGKTIHAWNWSFLTVPYACFESHLKWLLRSGYNTVDLHELYNHVSGNSILPSRSVVITFDDGYVDNWTYVAPLLARYGLKATVFVNPEFIDPRDIIRPSLNDLWKGRAKEDDLEVRGFMSWSELKQISDSGVFSVQSHLMSHTWYPISDEVVDFHHPGDAYYWLDWNARPEEKPFYLLNLGASKVQYGTPVYKHAKSMEVTRFFPDEKEALYLTKYVASNGWSDFFFKQDWRDELHAKLTEFRTNYDARGRKETAEERLRRLNYEMTESKRLIEEHIDTEVDFLAWPGGGYDDKTMSIAQKTYKSVTLSSNDRSQVLNSPGGDPTKVKRVGVPQITYKGNLFYPGGRYLVRFLDEYRGIPLARKMRQMIKLVHLLRLKVFSKRTVKNRMDLVD